MSECRCQICFGSLRQSNITKNPYRQVRKTCRFRFRTHRYEREALRQRRIDGILKPAHRESRIECNSLAGNFSAEMQSPPAAFLRVVYLAGVEAAHRKH